MFTAQSLVVGPISAPIQLRTNDKITSLPLQLLKYNSKSRLRSPRTVNLSSVEEIDAIFPCLAETFYSCLFVIDLTAESDPENGGIG